MMSMVKTKSKRKKIWLLALVVFLLALIPFYLWQNDSIITTELTYTSDKLPEAFDGYRILQISDLHNKRFGIEQKNVLSKIEAMQPDMIVITGDLIDSATKNIENAMELIIGAVNIAPVYYVNGNNDIYAIPYMDLIEQMNQAGVITLADQKTELSKDGETIEVAGLAESSIFRARLIKNYVDYVESHLKELAGESKKFKILLAHRPELLDYYAQSGFDLVFAGHAHGGQIRLPFIGAIFAPDQGLFPKLTEGMHVKDDTTLVISRGLGSSVIPVRLFNRPELLVVSLRK